MKRALIAVTFLIVLMGAFACTSSHTIVSAIRGRVVDDNGYALPGVTVTVSAAGRTLTAVTDADGLYAITGVPPGRYTIVSALSGLTTMTQQLTVRAHDERLVTVMRAPVGCLTATAPVPMSNAVSGRSRCATKTRRKT